MSKFTKSDLLRLLADSLDREGELQTVIKHLTNENVEAAEEANVQRTHLLHEIDVLQADLARRCNEIADLQYVINYRLAGRDRRQEVQ